MLNGLPASPGLKASASRTRLLAGTVGGAGPAGPGPTLQQARVVSVTQAMAEGDLAANTVLSSQWFRHPECSLGVWWRMSGHLKNGYIKVDLVSASFDSAAAPPVEIALCAVQVSLPPFLHSKSSFRVQAHARPRIEGPHPSCPVRPSLSRRSASRRRNVPAL